MWSLAPGLALAVNGAFTDAKYVRFANAPCPPELSGGSAASATNPASPAGQAGSATQPSYSPAQCDISGQRLPGISKWSFSFGGEYNVPVGSKGGEAYVGYDGNYRSRFSSNPSPSAYTWIEGYSLSNVRAGYREGGINVAAGQRCEVPTGFAAFPGDALMPPPPRSRVELCFNLVHWTEPGMGGHFAAMEAPQAFAADVIKWADKVWLTETHA